jgi:dolichol-phosphate mannosyltransferase
MIVIENPAERDAVQLSVVIPVFNEVENVLPLLDEVTAALDGRVGYEVIFVDDGSTDTTAQVLAPRLTPGSGVRLVRHRNRAGQSAAVRTGVRAAHGGWIATLDGDGQNDPADIPALFAAARAQPPGAAGAPALVGGLRLTRRDTWSKRLASRFANRLRQLLLDDGCTDTGCGIKVFRRDAFLDLPYFAAQHRFMPALFRAHGFAVAFVPVNHRPRLRGRSKYTNVGRALVGIVDLAGVFWLQRRTPPSPGAAEG